MPFHQLASTLDAVMIGYGFAIGETRSIAGPGQQGAIVDVFLFSFKGPPARSGVPTDPVCRPERGKALDRARTGADR